MSQGAWVLTAALVLASALGVYRAASDGRFRSRPGRTPRAPDPADLAASAPEVLHGTGFEDRMGSRATLVQFSSAFCAPCRATRRVLSEVAAVVPGVAYVEIDAEHHLELVRRLGVVRTPTTLILDAHGAEVTRATGAPRKAAVIATLGATLRP